MSKNVANLNVAFWAVAATPDFTIREARCANLVDL
jgi:hypothetical protein